eukprot:2727688-Amphidinium_carterae.1
MRTPCKTLEGAPYMLSRNGFVGATVPPFSGPIPDQQQSIPVAAAAGQEPLLQACISFSSHGTSCADLLELFASNLAHELWEHTCADGSFHGAD